MSARVLAAAGCAAAMIAAASTIRADDTAACIAAHVEAQRLQRDRNVRAARDVLVQCSRPSCPKIVLEECTTMLAQVEQAVPTVVFEARDSKGRDVAGARVSVGDRVLSDRLDGKAVEVDPGEHVFRFEMPGAAPVETRVIVREGDKGRRVAVTFFPPPEQPPAPAAATGRSIPPLAWVAGGVGVVGLSLFGALGIAGLSVRSDLDDRGCKPNCPSDEVDDARVLFIAADVALVVGIAALAAAPIIYFTSAPPDKGGSTAAPVTRRRVAAAPGPRVSIGVAREAARLQVGGRW